MLSYHLNDIPDRLKLSGPVIASIFLGRITEWDDPAIARLNPGVQLPSQAITPIFRLDSSGDTYALTDYLSKVSPQWKKKVGASTQVDFPVGTGARGNAGIAGAITRTDGGIGYLAIPYVAAHGLESAAIENAAGRFPAPGIPSISAAAQTLRSLPPGNTVSITDPPASAPGAYPISTFTYALVPEQSGKADALKPFLTYAIGEGRALGARYKFAPLPPVVRAADRETIARIHP
jgi:phosphate transport system substrate-binding protein